MIDVYISDYSNYIEKLEMHFWEENISEIKEFSVEPDEYFWINIEETLKVQISHLIPELIKWVRCL